MASTDLGACEWFVWDLRRSNLIDRGQLDQVVGEFLKKQPRAEPPALAEYLVEQQVLTQFQAERILQGKTQGLVLGPYTLTDAIGSGSMGTVYKAHSKTDGQWYAVKVLPRRSMWNVRLARRQVRAFEQVKHPAVVPFVDVGTAGGLHYLAWPLVEGGESLESIVEREGKLSHGQAAAIALQIAAGLNACHQHGIFHGLLKPSNVLITADGQAHTLDYGIGSLLAENEGESLVDTMSTANTMTSGLDCASPESIMEPTNRTPEGDQYSLGCVIYFCLTGRYPFPEESAVAKMMAHQTKKPTPIRELSPDVPDLLCAVVDRLMEKEPKARYRGMDEVIEALRPLAPSGSSVRIAVKSAAPPPAAPSRRLDNGQAAPAAAAPPPVRRAAPTAPATTSIKAAPPPPAPAAPTSPEAAARSLRDAFRTGKPAVVAATPTPPPAAPPAPEEPAAPQIPERGQYVPPGGWEENTPFLERFSEQLGPVGITVLAILVFALVWFLSMKLLFPS